MLDVITGGSQAYEQVGWFVGALVCMGLGGLLLGNALYWRLHARRVLGTIIGVLDNKTTYTPVYRYTSPDGQSIEARSDTSSGSVKGKETGRIVPLMISAHDPSSAREANGHLLEIIGLLLIAPGMLFAYTAVTSYPVTPMTWLMAGALLIYLAERGRRVLIPKSERLSLEEWRNQRGTGAKLDVSQVKPIEALVSFDTARERSQVEQNQARKWAPVIAIFALILGAVGVYQSISLAHLQTGGLRAAGQVVRLKQESSSGNSRTYYPIVQFRTDHDMVVEFKDAIGSNPPSYRTGDRVTVLYLAASPQSSAIIDRGPFWNWVIPGVLFLAAGCVGAILIWVLRGTERRPAVYSPG